MSEEMKDEIIERLDRIEKTISTFDEKVESIKTLVEHLNLSFNRNNTF